MCSQCNTHVDRMFILRHLAYANIIISCHCILGQPVVMCMRCLSTSIHSLGFWCLELCIGTRTVPSQDQRVHAISNVMDDGCPTAPQNVVEKLLSVLVRQCVTVQLLACKVPMLVSNFLLTKHMKQDVCGHMLCLYREEGSLNALRTFVASMSPVNFNKCQKLSHPSHDTYHRLGRLPLVTFGMRWCPF